MSVLSVGRVAGPMSPVRRERREDSMSCGAKRRFSVGLAARAGSLLGSSVHNVAGGVSDWGDGDGVYSAAGAVGTADACCEPFLRKRSNVVSIGTGANRRRAGCPVLVGVSLMGVSV